MSFEESHGLLGVGCFEYRESGLLQPLAIVDPDQFLVLDDEDRGALRRGRILPAHPFLLVRWASVIGTSASRRSLIIISGSARLFERLQSAGAGLKPDALARCGDRLRRSFGSK